MMRKVIWGGVAVAVCGTVAILMAAEHAAEHPDSLLARCANMAGYVASRCTPLLHWTHQPVKSKAVQARIICCQAEQAPQAVLVEDVPENMVPEDIAPEAVEPIVVENAVVVIDESSEFGIEIGVANSFRPSRFVSGLTAAGEVSLSTPAGEESNEPPQAVEAEQNGIPRMPYADEDEAPATDDGSGSIEWQQMIGWFWGCSARESAACVPHGHFQMTLEQMIERIKGCQEETAPADAVEEDAPREDATIDEEPQDETGEDPIDPPQCEEDRHYHHHYPSCPYTGRCVYPPHYQPVTPRDLQRVTTQPEAPETQDAPKPEPEQQPKPEPEQTSKALLKKKFKTADVCPLHPEIDTLECRPSDGPEDYDLDEPF